MRSLLVVLLAPAALAAPAAAPAAAWPLGAELLMAADAASYAPPDFKRQLARHRERLMAGVRDAVAGDPGSRTHAEHRAAAARGARAIAKMIRDHVPFWEVAYHCGGIVHEMARTFPPRSDAAAASAAARSSRFLGYREPAFGDPETLAAASAPAGGPREAFDGSVTLTTRLLAWSWKAAGGDASVVRQYPEQKGPYSIRD